jgi:hypothetical protein
MDHRLRSALLCSTSDWVSGVWQFETRGKADLPLEIGWDREWDRKTDLCPWSQGRDRKLCSPYWVAMDVPIERQSSRGSSRVTEVGDGNQHDLLDDAGTGGLLDRATHRYDS